MKQQVILEMMQQGISANPLFVSLLSILFVFLVIKFIRRGSTTYSLPPSPPKLPFIGNMHQLTGLLHHTLWALSRQYGPMMLLHLGKVPTLVVSSADVARDIMKTYDHVFSSRPLFLNPKRLLYGKDMVFAPYGEYWRQLRKVSMLQLLSAKKVQSFGYIREQEVVQIMEKIRASPDSSVNLRAMFIALTSNIVCRVAIGRNYNDGVGDGKRRSLNAIIDELAYLMGVPNIGDFLPSLAWVNHLNGLNRRVENNFKELDSIFDEIYEEHVKKGGVASEEDEDFVDIMLRAAKDRAFGLELGRDHIKAVIMDMFAAGTDTSAVVMEWAMSELMKNPKVREEAQNEVRGIAKEKRILTERDIENMHYLKLVVKETMRMHPPAPLLVPRLSTEDVHMQGYHIPANTTIMINAYAIGRDPKLWEKPELFNPKRYIDGSISDGVDFKGHDFQFIPFGAGRRGCPGLTFAIYVVELALANLLNNFDWELPNGISAEEFDMSETFGLTVSMKNNLVVCAKPR